MNKKAFTLGAAAIAGLLALQSPSNAAVEAYANLDISNFAFYNDLGGGVAGTVLTNGVEFNLVGATFSSSASADLSSVPGVTSTGVLPNVLASVGLDTLQAVQGSGAPGQNVFTPSGVATVARGDTVGSGAVVAGVPNSPNPATAQTVAEVQLPTAINNFDSGRADAAVTSSANFTIIPTGNLSIVGILTASREMITDLTPFPPGFTATADTSFNITVTDIIANQIIFEWSPNGVAGGVTGGVEYLDPFDLNGSQSGFPGFTIAPGRNTGLFSVGLSLVGGTPYSFSIEHSSSATATNFGVIPEPTTVAIWSLLMAGVCSINRRRS